MKKITFTFASLFLGCVGLVIAQSRSASEEVLSAENGVPTGSPITIERTVSGDILDFDWKPFSMLLVQ
ncbi:MAG: hypothetical protein LBH58_02815 [Tannerellaceae bacterium]|jgi:hypothetical protein|nr:hypothetical protein [Tannerellaceae bacterium]